MEVAKRKTEKKERQRKPGYQGANTTNNGAQKKD